MNPDNRMPEANRTGGSLPLSAEKTLQSRSPGRCRNRCETWYTFGDDAFFVLRTDAAGGRLERVIEFR